MNVSNRFPLWIIAFTITASSLATCTLAMAQGPDTSTRYHIVPHSNTINVSGGFAGVNDDYLITGGFDFLQLGGPPATTEFDNSEMWGSLITDQPAITIV